MSKKILYFSALICLVFLPVFALALSPLDSRANVDGSSDGVQLTDVILILKKVAGYENLSNWIDASTTGDVNCDGNLDLSDAILVLKKVGGYDEATLVGIGWCAGGEYQRSCVVNKDGQVLTYPELNPESTVLYLYATILGREATVEEAKGNIEYFKKNGLRKTVSLFMHSQEFLNHPANVDTYITRLYEKILGRHPSREEVEKNPTKELGEEGVEVSWADMFNAFLFSEEYKNKEVSRCEKVSNKSCLFDGKVIASGESFLAYNHVSVAPDEDCQSVTRKCEDGVISGSDDYKYLSCAVRNSLNCDIEREVVTPPDMVVKYLYETILGRTVSAEEARGNTEYFINNGLRKTVRLFMHSQEFLNHPANVDTYITRLYEKILGRHPSREEVENNPTKELGEEGVEDSWADMFNAFLTSEEYKIKQKTSCKQACSEIQFSLVKGAPTLNDFFEGRAEFGPPEIIEENFTTPFPPGQKSTSKLAIFKDPSSSDYYGFIRLHQPNSEGREMYNIFLMKSTDNGKTFTEVGPLFEKTENNTFYDPHLVINDHVCPAQYILTYECWWPGVEGASACVSTSSTPTVLASWTPPKLLVEACNGNPHVGCPTTVSGSASTPAMLVDDNGDMYISYTVVADHGPDRSYTRSAGFSLGKNFSKKYAMIGETILLDAEKNTHCNSTWDCNNRDMQDWKQEGDWYYAIYNGANYYRCDRPASDTGTNHWGLAISRSRQPMGPYSPAERPIRLSMKDHCDMSYPVINNIAGYLYMYYSIPNFEKRMKLQWK